MSIPSPLTPHKNNMTKVTIKSYSNGSHDGSFDFDLEDDEVLPFVTMASEMSTDELATLHADWTADDLETNPLAEEKVYLTATRGVKG
jgi:hypothetical protein